MLSTLVISAANRNIDFLHNGCCPEQTVVAINIPGTNNNIDCDFIRFMIV